MIITFLLSLVLFSLAFPFLIWSFFNMVTDADEVFGIAKWKAIRYSMLISLAALIILFTSIIFII